MKAWLKGGLIFGGLGLVSLLILLIPLIINPPLGMGGVGIPFLFLIPIIIFVIGVLAVKIYNKNRILCYIFFVVLCLVYLGFNLFQVLSNPNNSGRVIYFILFFIQSFFYSLIFSLGLLWILDNFVNKNI